MDKPNGFESFLREWCERQGWPFQPEMVAKDVLAQWRCDACGHSPQTCTCEAQAYWGEVEGTDEWEMAQLDRAAMREYLNDEDENAN